MSAHGEHKGREWWKVSARRWAYLSILTLLGLAVCLLLHPFLLRANAWLQGLFSLWPWFIQVALLLPFIIAPWAFLVHRGGLQFGWFVVPKVSWRYPPAWLAGAVGAFAYLLITRVFYPVLGKHALSWEVGYLVLALAAGWALVGVCSHFMCRAKAETETDETESSAESGTKDDLDALVKDPEKLIEWIMQKDSLTHPNGDLFGAAACARRVARRLLDRERAITIGLVGAYGSGKSSIINMARHYVKKPAQLREAPGSEDLPLVTDDESKTVASCLIRGWGLREGSAAEHILQAIINELSRYVDCLGLASLPANYGKALSKLGNTWFPALAALLEGRCSTDATLGKLDDVLEAAGIRLLVYLEDLDRNEEFSSSLDEIHALIDRMKAMKNASCVFAVGQERSSTEVLVRVADYIERVPQVQKDQFRDICVAFRKACEARFPDDVQVMTEEECDERLGLIPSRTDPYDIFGFPAPKPIDHVAGFLGSPRLMKSAFKRIWAAWQHLHGEVDLDELLVANALRSGAPEAYAFVLAEVQALRRLPREWNRDSADGVEKMRAEHAQSLEDAFGKASQGRTWDRVAAWKLVSFLFPGPSSSGGHAPQGVARSNGTDYLTRINAEEIPDGEMRDQNVLRTIQEWKGDTEASSASGMTLPEALLFNEESSSRIVQFSSLFTEEDVRKLAGEYFELIREGRCERLRDQGRPGYYPGFVDVCRLLRQKAGIIDENGHAEWVQEEVTKALRVSLAFANDLYERTWLALFGSDMPSPDFRGKFVETARTLYSNDTDCFVRALEPGLFDDILNFVRSVCDQQKGGRGFNALEWKWLAKALLKASGVCPGEVMPRLASMTCEERTRRQVVRSGKSSIEYTHKWNEEKVQELFGDRLRDLMEVLACDFDDSRLSGEMRALIAFCQAKAKKWLAENPATEPDQDLEEAASPK